MFYLYSEMLMGTDPLDKSTYAFIFWCAIIYGFCKGIYDWKEGQ